MKWHDARTEPPNFETHYILKGQIAEGDVTIGADRRTWWTYYDATFLVENYPFYATVEEVEKELEKNE